MDIAAGEFVNIVLFDNGKVAAWGAHDYGVDPRPPSGQTHHTPYSVIYERQNDPVNPWRFSAIAAGGHFVAALGFVGRFVPGPMPQQPIEGEVITWGTFDYAQDDSFGPNYRKNDPNQPDRPAGQELWLPWSTKQCGWGTSTPQTYMPPYQAVGANHQGCWGITSAGGAVHGWGNQAGGQLLVPASTQYLQVTGGYHSWGNTIMRDAQGFFRITGWGNITSQGGETVPCPSSRADMLPTGAPTSIVDYYYRLAPNNCSYAVQLGMCHSANCDGSTAWPYLSANDFLCFTNRFAAAQSLSNHLQIIDYANCDGSTGNPALTANDFQCYTSLWATQYDLIVNHGMPKPCP